jgi:hypothetical protein
MHNDTVLDADATSPSKPSLFIGSSTEGLEFARGVREALDGIAETTLWESAFPPGGTFIDTLLNTLPQYDFAVLVLTPDTLVSDREQEALAPRDNLLFELGLFMGRLGRSRTFILHQNTAFKLPSDLAGVTTLKYNWPRIDHSHVQAIGPASDSIRRAIQALGFIDTKTARTVSELSRKQENHERTLSHHQRQIRSLQVALQGVVTQYELDKLVGLASEEPFWCYFSDDLYNELKRLRAMDLARHNDGTGLRDMRDWYRDKNEQFDLKRFFHITEAGAEYLVLRQGITNLADDQA